MTPAQQEELYDRLKAVIEDYGLDVVTDAIINLNITDGYLKRMDVSSDSPPQSAQRRSPPEDPITV